MNNVSIYGGNYTLRTVPEEFQSSLTIRNYSGSTATVYRVENGQPVVALSLAPLQEIYPYQIGFRSGEALVFEMGDARYNFVAPTRAQIYLTPYGPLVNNQNPQSFDDKGKTWNSDWGYGLINVAASLELSGTPTTLSNLDGANNFAALQAIKAPDAWEAGYTGKGIIVAVIDKGVASHTKLDAALVKGYDFADRDDDPTPSPGYSHATGVASIIAASHQPTSSGPDVWGVAPDVKILNLRTGDTLLSDAEAIRWSADNGARVCVVPMNGDWAILNKAFVDAVQYAFEKNVVVVIIGGNFSRYGGSAYSLAARYEYTALIGNNETGFELVQKNLSAIAVGDFVLTKDALSPFTNVPGQTPFPWVVAPSTGYVADLNGGYSYWEDGGTSFAGPYVAGLAALLFQKYPNASAQFIIERIIAGAAVPENHAPTFTPGPISSDLSMIVGTPGDAVITAKSSSIIFANGGAPLIQGSPLGDRISTGPGGHVVYGNGGRDEILGGSGTDRLFGGAQSDMLAGSAGNDTLTGAGGNDQLFGGDGDDVLDGGSGVDEASYTGRFSDYHVQFEGENLIIEDLRKASGQPIENYQNYIKPDGRDTLTGIEKLRFADRQFNIINNQLQEVSVDATVLKSGGAAFKTVAEANRSFGSNDSHLVWIENASSRDLRLSVVGAGDFWFYPILPANATGYQAIPFNIAEGQTILLESADGAIQFGFSAAEPGRLFITDAGNYFQAKPQYQTIVGEDVWDSYLGYGLINYALALGVATGSALSTEGKNNHAALNTVGASAAQAAGLTGKGVTIAIIGAGIASHAAINDKILASYDVGTGTSSAQPTVSIDHDLSVASILVGTGGELSGGKVTGVVPDAKLLNVRVSGADETGFAKGIYWAIERGAKVILLEMSSGQGSYPPSFYDAVRFAYDHNVVVVCTSGNYSEYGGTSLGLVARDGIALVNGNYNMKTSDAFDSSNVAGDYLSSWVVAPSSGYVLTASGELQYWEDGGCSYAGPYVAGLAALLFEQNPGATAKFVIDKITSSASLPAREEPPAQGRIIYCDSYDDQISSGLGNDTIYDGAGDNQIDGGPGRDEVVFRDRLALVTLRVEGNKIIVLSESQGTDTLINVETLRFADRTISTADILRDFQPKGFNFLTPDGFKGVIGGTGTVIGTRGAQDISVASKAGTITFDASFNAGGDTIRLPGDAETWTIARSGSSAKLVSADLTVLIPVGTVGANIKFADGSRKLIYEGGAFKIGAQSFSADASAIVAPSSGAQDPTIQLEATARLILATNGEAQVGGKVTVTGTADGRESISIIGGTITFDASFNRGGDVVDLLGKASGFSATRSGSSAIITNGTDRVTIPVGTFGTDILFDDTSLVLAFTNGAFQIGSQVLSASNAPIIG